MRDIPEYLERDFGARFMHENGPESLTGENIRKDAYWAQFRPNKEMLEEGRADRNRMNYADKKKGPVFNNRSDD
jgi:hypothetical protein